MNDLISQAHAIDFAQNAWENITKEQLLSFLGKLDTVFNLLEQVGVVDLYSGNKLLQDFEIVDTLYAGKIIRAEDGKECNFDWRPIAREVVKILTN